MLIKFLKSYDMWEDDYTCWYDLYSIDNVQVYPLNDYDNTEIPKWVIERFEETLNGSKLSYDGVILSLYYDLIITSSDDCTFDDFYLDNIYNTEYLEKRLKDELWVTVEVI